MDKLRFYLLEPKKKLQLLSRNPAFIVDFKRQLRFNAQREGLN